MSEELSYSVLGPLEVSRGARSLPIRAGKQRILLAALLVSANRLVPVDELVERLWGQRPPATARATLATYVMRLRRVLAGPGQPLGDGPIRTRPEGY
ncbi:MAG TPA: winged helix-turn-helix domain-containing protein, partial [Actinopolymorphaceae bacterium]|nr:winged helix-turn-helix domain-containing protein [Actinopolymorphaceae bacterium]